MAGTGPATIDFGNVHTSKGFTFTHSPGTRPSTCFVSVPAYQNAVPAWVADLKLIDPGYGTLTFRDCILASPQLGSSPQGGAIWTLPILDRRWKWQYGRVYGHYNRRKKNGDYESKKTVKELLDILAAAMGEPVYDSDLPKNLAGQWIERMWVGQSAAVELENLCAEINCAPTLNPFTNKLEITRLDYPVSITDGPTFGRGGTLIDPQIPKSFVGEAGPTIFQATWDVEPVGLDTDGQWKHIDSLSYKRGEWTIGEALTGFHKYTDDDTYTINGEEHLLRDLAAAHVFRSFRLIGSEMLNASPVGGKLIVPGGDIAWPQGDKPESIKRDILFLNRLAEDQIDADNALVPVPNRVFAKYFREYHGTSEKMVVYPFAFGFNTDEGILTFGSVMWKIENGEASVADIKFECGFQAGKDRRWHRYRTNPINTLMPVQTPVHVLQRPEIQLTAIYRASYGSGVAGPDTTKANVEKALQYYLQAEQATYASRDAATWTFPNLQAYYANGVIEQVTWSGGNNSPSSTVVSRGQRHERYSPPLDEQRRRRAQADLMQITVNTIKLAAEGGGT